MDMGEINVWYYTEGSNDNFGDYLGYYIPHKMTGKKINLLNINSPVPKYVTVGSVLNQMIGINPTCTVWGAGIMTVHDTIPHNVKLLAVRGKYTQQRLKDIGITPPDVIGDPALILKKLYNPSIEKKYKLGIIPHYVDYDYVRKNVSDPNIKIINLLTNDIEGVIDQILSCEYTISSSLHGLIVSHAYDVPSLWVKFSEKLFGNEERLGNNVKFRDYFSSVGIQPYDGFNYINKPISLDEIIDTIVTNDSINHIVDFDFDKLYNSCPFL